MTAPGSAGTTPTQEAPPPAREGGRGPGGSGYVRRATRLVRRLPAMVLLGMIRGYQLIVSPWTAPSCRYYPSCSQYAVIALQRHGALRGGWLAVRRLLRCHPWTPGGVDDVPPVRDEQTSAQVRGPGAARSTKR
jgi:uncharacterized protein